MEEKKITVEEFDGAVKQVMSNMIDDDKLQGMSKLIVPLVGTIFAKDMRKILFGEVSDDQH